MHLKYIEKLEYDTILEKLSSFCSTETGKQFCLHLVPSSNQQEVLNKLQETNEAVTLVMRNQAFY